MKNGYFHKILKIIFCLMPVKCKIRKFENKFAKQHDLHSSTIFLSDTTFLLFRNLTE